jgi:hypothetical protein
MTGHVGSERLAFGIAVLGGPTTVLDIAGLRIVVDPTFDPPGDMGYLTKLSGPAAGPRQGRLSRGVGVVTRR